MKNIASSCLAIALITALSCSKNASFSLAKNHIVTGEAPCVAFTRPLSPKQGEKYWITVVEADAPDSAWGLWQYAEAGAAEATLKSPQSAGKYEVRLHDGYPAKNYHVVHRALLTVEPSNSTVASAALGKAPAASPSIQNTGAPGAPFGQQPGDKASSDNPFKALSFKTEEEVLAQVGHPTAKLMQEDRVSWYYKTEVTGLSGEKSNPELQFMGGQVRAIIYWPANTMDDKIATAWLNQGTENSASRPARPRTFNFAETFDLVSGKTKTEVLRALGEPTSKRIMSGDEVWQYDDLVKEEGKFRLFAIRFQGEVVAEARGM